MNIKETKFVQNEMIILFDGVCNFCNQFVTFVIDNDSKSLFYFASLQSEIGVNLLEKHQIDTQSIDSIVLIERNKAYIKSTAALKIARELGVRYSLFYYLIILPRPFRDWIYGIVARNRYKWFGKRENCMIPNKDVLSRFLADSTN